MTVASIKQARPRAPRLTADRRREHLLDVAAAIIMTSGFERLTMESLARRAGVSKGLGYAYFTNAHDVAVAVHDREIAVLYSRIEEATGAARAFEEKVRCAVSAHFDAVAERGLLLGTLTAKLSGQARSRELRGRIRRFVAFWARLIAAEFSPSPKSAHAIAAATLSAADALTRIWVSGSVPRSEVEHLCADFILGGIRAAVEGATEARRARPV